MNTVLGVLLPVYNAENSLAEGVAGILEVLPEWAARFELCIIDDGSTDDTAEVALDLAARYPQLRVTRHPLRLGLDEAIQTGLDHSQGEIILIGNDAYRLDPDDLRALWQLRDAERRMTRSGDSTQADDLPRGGLQQLGYQVIRRKTFEQFHLARAVEAIARIDAANRAAGPSAVRPNFLGRVKRFTLGE